MTELAKLKEPFPREAVSWRAQSVTRAGDKALALAYIDARDVMNRLDEVCGPEGWQSRIEETAKGRVLTTISIRIGNDWISKCDGAGATDIEGDKGAISDSLKRCAVQWGIARYLYDIASPWVPCESEEYNGKRQWKRWTADPWSCVKGQAPLNPTPPSTPPADPPPLPEEVKLVLMSIKLCETLPQLKTYFEQEWPGVPKEHRKAVLAAKDERKAEIEMMDGSAG